MSNVPSSGSLPKDETTNIKIGQTSLFVKDIDGGYYPLDQDHALAVTDFVTEVGRGNVANNVEITVFGHNPAQIAAAGVQVDVNEFGDLVYLTAGERMNITSSSADDDAGGIGAHTVSFVGLDDNYDLIDEVVALNGVANVLTVNSYLRVLQILTLQSGTSGFNLGAITATAETAATIQNRMLAKEGVSQSSNFTVPRGFTFEARAVKINAAKQTGGQSPIIEVVGYVRPLGLSWIQFFNKKFDTAVIADLEIKLSTPTSFFTEKSDFKIVTITDQNDTETRTSMEGILYAQPGFTPSALAIACLRNLV